MELSIFWLIFLFIAAILTSIINAVAAVGGGMTLFVIMISLLNYAVVVPVHGIIQVWSSAARVIIFRHDVNWGLMKYFLITYIPSVIVGIFLWRLIIDMSEIQPLIKISIAAYLLLYLANYSIKIRTQNRKKLMLYAGAWSGIISLTAGSPAPVMAPLFMKANFYKEDFFGMVEILFYIWIEL